MTILWQFDGSFRIDVARVGDNHRITFTGELDAFTANRLGANDPIRVYAGNRYTLDLAALETIDASGVRAIRRIEAVITDAGASAEVLGATPEMRRLFDLIPNAARPGATRQPR